MTTSPVFCLGKILPSDLACYSKSINRFAFYYSQTNAAMLWSVLAVVEEEDLLTPSRFHSSCNEIDENGKARCFIPMINLNPVLMPTIIFNYKRPL